jgi:hypothetical protein
MCVFYIIKHNLTRVPVQYVLMDWYLRFGELYHMCASHEYKKIHKLVCLWICIRKYERDDGIGFPPFFNDNFNKNSHFL